ncbi:hypothetical protein CHLRE_09g406448v5 [Chlamydomonas reinhardtii]|uniref:Uncharacterized protein n=1 Tax=Chlamydomonas reinhardtii TaxID=3055 RepID=A0A2K3DFB2_CHLRE|nr:uncharacterized protein CHLRE_09g406448v5 [Chlamydomonas reinhardtii]PNW79215.1 hypothetical protein CHLRE_09g406448v5 [Chlamydomonas reinhardtii]
MVKAQTISMLAMTGPQRGALAISNGGDIITAAADMEPLWTAPDFSRWQNLTLVRKGIAGDQALRPSTAHIKEFMRSLPLRPSDQRAVLL